MIYLNTFDSHASYEDKLNGGGVDISLPNVSYCKDVKDVHYTYNLVRFYVGEITGTTPQTVKIYTDSSTSIPIQVSKGNKWYSYAIPKNKELHSIKSGVFNHDAGWTNSIVKKVAIRADINYLSNIDDGINELFNIIPTSTIEVSFNGIDTSKLIDMSFMFYNCSGLTSLDVSSFNTSNVLSMAGTFCGCSGLTALNVSNFDTSNVIMTSSMFAFCSSLTSLDVSNFNTSNVTDMSGTFYGCNGLTTLDLSKWDTSKVTGMNQMFYGCTNLETLDLSSWEIHITDMYTWMGEMFKGCSNLNTIRMKGCSPETVEKIRKQLKEDGITRDDIIKTE